MGILWTIIIGFIAGIIAKLIMPGRNEPSGFILTTILGIVGAVIATYLGQAIGWYRADEGAGLIGAIVGAIIVLGVWAAVTRSRGPSSPRIAARLPRIDVSGARCALRGGSVFRCWDGCSQVARRLRSLCGSLRPAGAQLSAACPTTGTFPHCPRLSPDCFCLTPGTEGVPNE